MNHYYVLVNRFEKGKGADPGDKAAWESNIRYTRLENRWTAISPEQRHQIRNALMAQSAAMAPLQWLLTREGVYDAEPAPTIEMVRKAFAAHKATTELLDRIANEPES